jgi:dipeptidyl aminopeptidase/acylaminoacyl peptidase
VLAIAAASHWRHHVGPMNLPWSRLTCLAGLFLAACSGGGSSSDPIDDVPPELLACRARFDSPFQFAEVALRSSQNLGSRRIADRTGTERHARLHPDGNTVVFSRERSNADPNSRELIVAVIDGSNPELRLTQNNVLDDEPCWSPDGSRILFASERSGPKSLWLVDPDGSNSQAFLTPPAGESDGEPDWCRATDRVVWSRSDATGHHTLWVANGSGSGIMPLSDGGILSGSDTGDFAPAFSADGTKVAFVRRASAVLSSLCIVELATGDVAVRLLPAGQVGTPRWSPAMDRLFFGLAEPTAGRQTMRLAVAPVGPGAPTLVWPDERWELTGLDVLPGLSSPPAALAPRTLDVGNAEIQLAAGSGVFGERQQLTTADGDEFAIQTATFNQREVAGINCKFDLPVLRAEDVLELRVRVLARATRIGGDTALRVGIYNPVDERFDTAVELAPGATSLQEMSFSTSSLRHVTRQRQLRVEVIADIAPGERSELRIDLVEVVMVARDGN